MARLSVALVLPARGAQNPPPQPAAASPPLVGSLVALTTLALDGAATTTSLNQCAEGKRGAAPAVADAAVADEVRDAVTMGAASKGNACVARKAVVVDARVVAGAARSTAAAKAAAVATLCGGSWARARAAMASAVARRPRGTKTASLATAAAGAGAGVAEPADNGTP